jgi:CubicO group peptidase (beta-lactamase class C family)
MNDFAINGITASRFEPLREVLADQLRSGAELGLSLAVDVDGERVVDLWAGHRDGHREQPWERDTVTNVWSITKTVTTLAVLLLVDRGEIDVYAPVASYWPEFAARGKDDIEVRHLLSHTAGLSGLDRPVTLDDLYDTRGMADRLAAQEPWWAPGSASGYHVLTYGHLLGELVQRVSGMPLREFVAEHLVRPAGADFSIGLPTAARGRVTDVVPPPLDFDPEVLDHDSVAYRTFTGPAFTAAAANTTAWRSADLGAANGHGNAASVADVLAPVALGGETAGGRLLQDKTLELVFEEQSNGIDLVNGLHLR